MNYIKLKENHKRRVAPDTMSGKWGLLIRWILTSVMIFLIILVMGLSISSCNDSRLDPAALEILALQGSQNVSRSSILEHLAVEVIFSSFKDLDEKAKDLHDAALAYEKSPGETNLAALQSAWKRTKKAMSRVETYRMGPGVNPGEDFEQLDFRPFGFELNTEKIEKKIAGDSLISVGNLSIQGVTVKGLPTIEYLIFSDETGDDDSEAIVSGLTGRRLDYLLVCTEYAYRITTSFKNNWDPDGDGDRYVNELRNAGRGSKAFKTQLDAFSELIIQMLDQMSRIIDYKIGYPAGLSVKSGGNIHLDRLETPYSSFDIESLSANTDSMKRLFTGNEDNEDAVGLSEFVAPINEDLNNEIMAKFEEVEEKITELKAGYSGSLRLAIESDADEVEELFILYKDLRVLMGTDLVSNTGTNPGVGSSDGD